VYCADAVLQKINEKKKMERKNRFILGLYGSKMHIAPKALK
jgi:hypothetical protein